MSPLDALWHLLNFLAPAWVVAALVAVLAKLLWRQAIKSQTWRRLALWGGIGGSVGLIAALALFGRDGKMAGYGLMIVAVALPQWWLAFRPGR